MSDRIKPYEDEVRKNKGIWICNQCGAENLFKFELCRNCAKGKREDAKIIDREKTSKYLGE